MTIRLSEVVPGTAAETAFTPADTISATTVQDAIVEALTDARSYSDAVASGLDIKNSVRVATNAALPTNTVTSNVMTASANGVIPAVDTSVTLVVGDRVLVKNEVAGANNGIYTVTSLGAVGAPWVLTRATDADTSSKVTSGLFVMASEGANAPKGWVLTTNDPINLGSTALAFSQFTPYQRDLLLGANGTGASDICTKAGTSVADASVDAGAKLFSVETGIGGTAVEKLSVNKAGVVSCGGVTSTGPVRGSVTALTSTSNSVAINLGVSNDFTYTTAEASTLAAPTNAIAGQKGRIVITQGATPYTLAFDAKYLFAGGVRPALTSTAGAIDYLSYDVLDANHILVALAKGFA